MDGSRRLKVLFSIERPGTLRQYASLVALLGERGHEVRLAFPREPIKHERELVAQVLNASPRITYTLSPGRPVEDGWRTVAWLVRALGDLARFSDPRYDAAPVLRRRMASLVVQRLDRRKQFDPVARALGLRIARRLAATSDAKLSRRAIATAARLEAAIPTSDRVDDWIRDEAPDVVLASPLVKYASNQVEILKSARAASLPTGIGVASWDNLTNKGLLKFVPERVFVWNEIQRREAKEMHGIPAERVVATGAQLFDEWFERRPSSSREEFVRRAGLDAAEPYVLFLGSSAFIAKAAERDFVPRWIDAVRSAGDERVRRVGIMVRPHPSMAHEWEGAAAELARYTNVVLWPPVSAKPIGEEARAAFFDSLAHSAAVVGINTTAMIEAAIVGKSVLTVLSSEFAQEDTLHFHYLLEENGGFLHTATSLEGHAQQLANVLAESVDDAERRRRFVEFFVRPHGLDKRATPILADAVEELAELTPDPPPRPSRALRLLLSVEAALARRVLERRERPLLFRRRERSVA